MRASRPHAEPSNIQPWIPPLQADPCGVPFGYATVLDKSILGGGSKSSLFAALLRDHSAEASALAMGRLAKLTARFLTDFGFSIGIEDVQPTTRLTAEKSSLLSRGYAQCDRKIAQFDAGKLQPSPGCTPEQTLESEINGLLSKIREDAGEICKHELHHLNAPLTMATYVARPAGPPRCPPVCLACAGRS